VAPVAGVNAYGDDGYVDDVVYQTQTGGSSLLVSGDLTYDNFEDFTVIDDGLDLFNMQPERILNSNSRTRGNGLALGRNSRLNSSWRNRSSSAPNRSSSYKVKKTGKSWSEPLPICFRTSSIGTSRSKCMNARCHACA